MLLCVLCFTSVVCGLLNAFFSPLLFFFGSPVVSLHTMLLVRGGDDLAAIRARTRIPFFPYVCGGGHRHSFGVTFCWFSLPVRFSLRFSWRRTLALLGT